MSTTGAAFWSDTFLKTTGAPYAACLAYHYEPGGTTARTVWSDEAATTSAANPVVGDSNGRVTFYGKGNYRIKVLASVADGSGTLADWDPVKLEDQPSGLRGELQATSYPSAVAANRGLIFFKVSAGGDVTEVGVNLDATGFSALQFQSATLTATQLLGKGADLASATALTLGTDGNTFDVTGTTTITSISSLAAGALIVLEFDGILLLTYNGTSLILPGNEDITTGVGDVSLWQSEGGGNWRCLSYVRRDGGNLFETKGDTLASASVAITAGSAATGQFYDISGTTAITALGTLPAGRVRKVRFTGILTLTHNGTSLIIPGAANITTANGAYAEFISLGSGNWFLSHYQPASNSILTLGTPVASTSGTSIDFTGIPAGTKEIVVMLAGVSTSITSNLLIQIGDAGGIENTAYISHAMNYTTGINNNTTGFILTVDVAAADVFSGAVVLRLNNSADFSWVSSGILNKTSDSNSNPVSGGSKKLSGELDRVRITTVNGTDTFDAGEINISYQG